jgi:hypothetical protein
MIAITIAPSTINRRGNLPPRVVGFASGTWGDGADGCDSSEACGINGAELGGASLIIRLRIQTAATKAMDPDFIQQPTGSINRRVFANCRFYKIDRNRCKTLELSMWHKFSMILCFPASRLGNVICISVDVTIVS